MVKIIYSGGEMKQKIVGVYYAGNESIQLVIGEGYGGEFYTTPEKGSVARIKIGMDSEWDTVLISLFHEIFEILFDRLKCRYKPSSDLSNSMASYLFVADHQDFGDVCARAAEFVNGCLGDLKKEYKLWHRKVKK